MISRWSSPIPLMIVWPVSSLVWMRKDGSSLASFAGPRRASRRRPWSWLDGDRDHGLGEFHLLEEDRVLSSQRVSPVGCLGGPRPRRCCRRRPLDLLALVGVHVQDAPEALALAARRLLTIVPLAILPE